MTILNGLYRATVVDDVDTNGVGRVQITIDSLPNEPAHWAMPCAPYAGTGVGLVLRPSVGDKVWVGFEGGEVSLPVWVGGYWDTNQDLPSPADQDARARVLRTNFGAVIIDEAASTLTVEVPGGALGISVSSAGTEISGTPSLKVAGPNDAHMQFQGGVVTIKGWPLGFEAPTDATLARIGELEAKVAALEALHQGS